MIKPYRQSQVRVTDAYFSNSCIKDVAYLKSIDTDRLLAGFYETAGLPMKKERYGGWESMLIAQRRHIMNMASPNEKKR